MPEGSGCPVFSVPIMPNKGRKEGNLYETGENSENSSLIRDFLKDRGTPEELHMISASNFVTDRFPPSFVMTANGDELKAQAPFMISALEKSNVKHVFKEYGDDSNTLYHVFHCNIKSPDAKVANDDECDFFKSLM